MNYFIIPGIKSAYRRESGPRMDKDIIVRTVCEYFEISETKVKSKGRAREITFARQIIMHYLFYYTDMNKVTIGNFMNRDHTTVIHSLRTLKNLMDTDSKILDKVTDIRGKIVENHS